MLDINLEGEIDGIHTKSTFGYSLINAFARKLDADISIQNNGGTTVNVAIRKFIET